MLHNTIVSEDATTDKPINATKEVLIAFRATNELNNSIRSAAEACNMTISTFIRSIVEANLTLIKTVSNLSAKP